MNLSTTNDQQTCTLGDRQNVCELDENLEILRRVPAFSGAPLERLRLFAFMSKRLFFKAGTFIIRQNDPARHAYILISGKAQVIKEYKERSALLNEFTAGEFFGGLALLSDIKRPVSVRAVTDICCLSMDRESFMKTFSQSPEVILKIVDFMLKRHFQMYDKFLEKLSPESITNINL
jgi:CRP-like cAMP-binding protein